MRSKLPLVASLLVIFSSWGSVSSEIYFGKGAPHVKLPSSGVLSGKVSFSRDGRPFSAFIGIKYAAVAERFAEATLVTEPSWEGVKSAVKPGNVCPQAQSFFSGDPTNDTLVGDEDCLNLNVYVPMNNTGNKFPVMVWVHGGGFMVGSGVAFDPRFFMDEDVILVAINYRLGVFGFLSTGDSVIPGNNGLKDDVLALQWVKQNIDAFGGDPEAITIFGESAGSGSVHHLLLSPTTKGLVHRAISQSGSALHFWTYHPDPKKIAIELATYMNCHTTAPEPSGISSQEILVCLKQVPWKDLLTAQLTFKQSWPMNLNSLYFGPTKESQNVQKSSVTPFQTESPFALLGNKKVPLVQIPWMVGITEDEGAVMSAGIILKFENLMEEINEKWNEIAPPTFGYGTFVPEKEHKAVAEKLRKFYFNSKKVSLDTRKALSDIFSDKFMNYGVYKAAVETASRGKQNPVYLYQYAHQGPISFCGLIFPSEEEEKKKVGHADDLILQWHLDDDLPTSGEDKVLIKPDSVHESFSKNFVKLWAAFAKHGEPTHTWGNSPNRDWKPIGDGPLEWYRLDSNPGHIEDPYKKRNAFWEKLYEEHFDSSLKSLSCGDNEKTEL